MVTTKCTHPKHFTSTLEGPKSDKLIQTAYTALTKLTALDNIQKNVEVRQIWVSILIHLLTRLTSLNLFLHQQNRIFVKIKSDNLHKSWNMVSIQ